MAQKGILGGAGVLAQLETFGKSGSCMDPTCRTEAEEVGKYEVFSWNGDLSDQLAAQFLISDQQRLKECREKRSELRETKLLCKNGKLNAENMALKAELEKHKMMAQHSEMKAKIDKIVEEKKQQLGKKIVTSSGDHSPPAVISGKIAKELPNLKQQNGWDAGVCHKDIEISGENQMTINCKGNRFGWRTVFAKFPITNFCRPGIFYFEMKVINLESFATIGFATKEVPLDGSIGLNLNSYGYRSDGSFGCNGINRPCKMPMPFVFPLEFSPVVMQSADLAMAYKPSEFSTGDIVGCGILKEFKQAFGIMDQDKDGVISKQDLKDLYATHGVVASDSQMDNILKEASWPGERLTGTDPEATIIGAFQMFDKTDFCKITEETLMKILKNKRGESPVLVDASLQIPFSELLNVFLAFAQAR
ncbi:hypothetical protein niasHT_015526 [Heterodera trifolii]|uniref:EF-hand domain-containing protein n=1 Tax=Heterodera trifolii TaxID=157864 RepID=A0ABD2L0J6_9BILA